MKVLLKHFTSSGTSFKTAKIEKLKKSNIPCHIAIIMDGSGRWAEKRNLPRIFGHKRGAEILREIVIASKDAGVKFLTVFSFSTENWNRPKDEVDGLMILFAEVLNRELPGLMKNDVKLNLLGRSEGIPKNVLEIFRNAENETAGNSSLVFNVAFNYGSRQEIFEAAVKFCKKIHPSSSNIENAGIDSFPENLYTGNMPDPDLLIRTSGEYRLSNFLLWQLAYTELYFTRTLWPDFSVRHFFRAIESYQKRTRRFGRI